MTAYGILLVDTSWANNDSVEIDKVTHMRHQDRIIEGTCALIYVRAPIDAIVAEAEVTGEIVESETLPPDPGFNPSIPANLHLEGVIEAVEGKAVAASQEFAKTYHVPLKIVRLKGQVAPISLEWLRTILGSDFSVFDETWIPLSEEQYQMITALWEKT